MSYVLKDTMHVMTDAEVYIAYLSLTKCLYLTSWESECVAGPLLITKVTYNPHSLTHKIYSPNVIPRIKNW